nr:tyrosine-protein phosphatase [Neobacillus sp. Marseille-Q6967]
MNNKNIHKCLLPLHGAINFRDMGGIETSDGRKVKKGILFRAAELAGLTEQDKSFLESLNIKSIFDYRRRAEAERKPDPMIGQAIHERVSVAAEDNITTHLFEKKDAPKEYFSQFTVEGFLKIYAKMPIENPSYQKLMERLKNPEENLPLIHHCTAGRDRTGVGAMIMLMTLGVPYEIVLEDYLLSNETLADYHNQIFIKTSEFFTEEEWIGFKDAFPLRADYLHAAYHSILQKYGYFDHYIMREFGITNEIRKKIQEFCLE